MNADQQKTQVFEVIDAVLRSWWTIVVALCLGGAAAIAALHYLPKTFEASTMILVTRPKISPALVPTTVEDDMKLRMASLREAVLSRPYLERIYKENYPPVSPGESLERAIIDLRWKVDVQVRRGLFSITFRDEDPRRAANVANTLAQLYIDENAAFRTSRAEDATRTLEELAGTALGELNAKEQAILEFKAKHPFEIEANIEPNLRMREMRQRDLETTERSRKYEEQQLEDLRTEFAAARSEVPGTISIEDPRGVRLATLQAELADLLTHYMDDHPTVRAKRREIDELRDSIEPPRTAGGSASGLSANAQRLQQRIQESERTLVQLEGEEARIRREIGRLDRRIESSPLVQAKLAELTKGLTALRERYEDYQRKVESAKGSEQLEAKRKGEQFEVIERAVPSSLPVRPRPMAVFGGNIAVALLIFVGPVVLRRVLRPIVWSESGLSGLADVPLLVTIPLLETDEVKRGRRRRHLAGLGVSVVSVAILAAAVAFLYV